MILGGRVVLWLFVYFCWRIHRVVMFAIAQLSCLCMLAHTRRSTGFVLVLLLLLPVSLPSAYVIHCYISFYHAMHYSAKRSLAIVCRRLSVCLSVTLVDHVLWISPGVISNLSGIRPSYPT